MTEPRREPKGAVEYAGGNAKYLQVSYGCLCEVSKKFVEGWVNPINQKTGETILDKWIKVYKEIDAWVNKLEWYENKYGENEYMGWKMHMEAGGVNYILDLALNGTATQKFMFSARNLDFNLPLEIAVWTNNNDGKLAVWLKQNDTTVLQYYKKGDMKNCPEPVSRVGVGGKTNWDWSETEKFLWDEMQTIIAPAITEAANARRGSNPEAYDTQPSGAQTDENNFSGPAQPNPVAQTLGDMISAAQLGMIRGIARELNIDADTQCKELMRCSVAELSKRAASDFIKHLQDLRDAPPTSSAAPPVAASTTPAPYDDDDIPF